MFDLETGKIVQQIKSGDNIVNFHQISNERKNGQKDVDQTLVGIDRSGIYKIDPRVKDSIIDSKIYAKTTNVHFNSLASTVSGTYATGSLDGAIRLYTQVGQNAKTLLPGLGEPIKSVDISLDEKWLLATCQTYLIVLPTETEAGSSGFQKSLGKEKPTPLKLTIQSSDIVKYQLDFINFTPARFNNGDNIEEDSIVTSVKNLLVIWNFAKVKRGVLRSYKIKPLDQAAVDGQFQFNNKERVFVTTSRNV